MVYTPRHALKPTVFGFARGLRSRGLSILMASTLAGGLALTMSCGGGGGGGSAEDTTSTQPAIQITQNGNTDYQIIIPASQTDIDKLAVKELREFLKQSTGADFKIFSGSSDEADRLTHRLFVGLSPSALKILGSDPCAGLTDQEHIVRSIGDDLFLFGKGEYGNLYAVYSFLENQVGCRWYTAYGDMHIPHYDTFELNPFDYRRRFAFQIRGLMNWALYPDQPTCNLFLYRNFQNQLLYSGISGIKPMYRENNPGVHTSFAYIPPAGNGINTTGAQPLDFLKDTKYYETNPEFFTMDGTGHRVNNRQLCFSHLDSSGRNVLRETLTANIETNIINCGGKGIFSIDQNDTIGSFCECSGCSNLETLYGTPGGPIFDYLIELCNKFKTTRPEVYIKTLAYYKAQTEVPPTGIARLPDNFILVFAPVENNVFAPFSHASNGESYQHLKRWGELSDHVWVWYYPNPYDTYCLRHVIPPPPFGNLEMIAEDIRLLKEAGVEGTYFEHDSGVRWRANFSELQAWLMLKLFQNPNQPLKPLVGEFTDFYYGAAAARMRDYIEDLERERKTLLGASAFSTKPLIHEYTYFTPDNMEKWERLFDTMESLTANSPDQLFHVKLTRMGLDAIVLVHWKKLTNKYPAMKPLLANIEARLTATYPGDKTNISKWIELGKPKPLPGFFNQFSEDALIQVNPGFPNYLFQKVSESDAQDAAWPGIATYCDTAMNPFTFGFYDVKNKIYLTNTYTIDKNTNDGVYTFYKLGPIKLSPSCEIIGDSQKWQIAIPLGHLFSVDEPDAQYDAYVSFKFEGPAYSTVTTGKPDRALCDRVVLVKK